MDLWLRFLATKEYRLTVELLIQKALESLLAGGPMALVLGAAIVVLWRENKSLQERLLAILEKIADMKEDKK